jgi:hypothetical protein
MVRTTLPTPSNDNGDGNGVSQTTNSPPSIRHGNSNTNANTDTSVPLWNVNDEPTPPNIQGFGTDTLPSPMGVSTSVDTATLSTFVTYIGSVLPSILDTRNALLAVEVQPGDFYDADQMRDKINGTSGLVGQFHSILTSLDNGLTSIQSGLRTLAVQYTDAEDLNNISVSQLQTSLGNAGSYFDSIITDAGGSSTTTSTSTGNDPGNSNNSNNSGNFGNSNNTSGSNSSTGN